MYVLIETHNSIILIYKNIFPVEVSVIKPRNKRKKRNSNESYDVSERRTEKSVRRKYRKQLILNVTKLRESDHLTDCEIKVDGKPVSIILTRHLYCFTLTRARF